MACASPATIQEVNASVSETHWAALMARDAEADGEFVYAVITTGVYCRPSCPSRRPLRKNVRTFALPAEAEAAGFRPCKRCRPKELSSQQRSALAVEAACRTIEHSDAPPSLASLAQDAGLSPYHFHRVFTAHTGVTPKAYADAVRAKRAQAALVSSPTVADAAFASGFASLSRFYEMATQRLAMSPAALAASGRGEVVVTAQSPSPLGIVTVAFSERGICAVRLSATAAEGEAEVRTLFNDAVLIDGGAEFDGLMSDVVAAIREPALAGELPLDVRGTAFEERVWAALRAIPYGATASYGEIAAAIGRPAAHRAVANACGANKIAVLIPCHRVIRSDGSLGGYRWGVTRKAALLELERRSAPAHP